jgi:hypothetical protein
MHNFFSLLGLQVKNKLNFFIVEACKWASHVGRNSQIKFGEHALLFCENCQDKNI